MITGRTFCPAIYIFCKLCYHNRSQQKGRFTYEFFGRKNYQGWHRAARQFGVFMVFAKKAESINLDSDVYAAEVESLTHGNRNQVIVSRKGLTKGESVLIIDDLLVIVESMDAATGSITFRPQSA